MRAAYLRRLSNPTIAGPGQTGQQAVHQHHHSVRKIPSAQPPSTQQPSPPGICLNTMLSSLVGRPEPRQQSRPLSTSTHRAPLVPGAVRHVPPLKHIPGECRSTNAPHRCASSPCGIVFCNNGREIGPGWVKPGQTGTADQQDGPVASGKQPAGVGRRRRRGVASASYSLPAAMTPSSGESAPAHIPRSRIKGR